MEKIVIHVAGIQGSGKSFLCNSLNKNILCVDTDDINIEANKINPFQTDKELKKKVNIIVNKYINNTKYKIIVFVGMTAEIKTKNKYFIKITDFVKTYKRVAMRELEKIYLNYHKVKKLIEQTKDVDNMDTDIFDITGISLYFPISYKDYVDNYNIMLEDAIKDNYKPMTQSQIINLINNIK